MSLRIVLVSAGNPTLESALAATQADLIVVADCYIAQVETWTPRPWGWETNAGGRVVRNVDHHAEDPRFFRKVSSGNLAIQYVNADGIRPDDAPAVINHTDFDAILSAAILTGLLPPAAVFGDAVLAADHTGEPNAIADLLQALDPLRDVGFSLESLDRLLQGQPLPPRAAELLEKRHDERRRARELAHAGAFRMVGPVAVAKLTREDKVAGELLPDLFPRAEAIVSASPMDNGRWETKVRLGRAAEPGETLYSLGIQQWEPNFHGRWNAGSTRRSGGSTIDPFLLARHMAEALTSSRSARGKGVIPPSPSPPTPSAP